MDHPHHLVEFAVIGGGIAGLSAANTLAERNREVLIIDAGTFPSHKVCGEFLSPEVLPLLEQWEIAVPGRIERAEYLLGETRFTIPLPAAAGGISRYILDSNLLERAKAQGASAMTGVSVASLYPPGNPSNDHFVLKLTNGRTVLAKSVIIGSGRIPLGDSVPQQAKFPYFGFKAHFSGISLENTLQMHLLPNAYLGISPIGKGVVNIACLARATRKTTQIPPQLFIERLLAVPHAAHIKQLLSCGTMQTSGWLTTRAPDFGVRTTPLIERAYFVGDAAGTIPPAAGDGLGMAVASGVMAAHYALRNDAAGYRSAWQQAFRSRISWGKFLHTLLIHSPSNAIALHLCRAFPAIPRHLYRLTRG